MKSNLPIPTSAYRQKQIVALLQRNPDGLTRRESVVLFSPKVAPWRYSTE